MKQIALVSYAGCPELSDDDRLLIPALRRLGAEAVPVVWDAPIAWTHFDQVILRSCWDYHLRPVEFLGWVERVESNGTRLSNSPSLVRWNADKRYLRQLETANVCIPPTKWISESEEADVHSILEANGWASAILKPTVSASAHGLRRVFIGEPPVRVAGPVMIQPFLPEIITPGEWSLVFFGGQFSHAVIKRPTDGDFRVQWQYEGSAKAERPPAHIIASAQEILTRLEEVPLYTRVDGIERNGGFVLMELELIEPELFLGLGAAADRFASAIVNLPAR